MPFLYDSFKKLIKTVQLIVANENTSHLLLRYLNCANQ